MTLFKKTKINAQMFFFFLCLISTKIYSQEQIQDTTICQSAYEDNLIDYKKYLNYLLQKAQNPAIIYQDTVILNSFALPIVFYGNFLNINGPLTPDFPFLKPIIPSIVISKHRLFADVYNKNALYRNAYNYLINNNIKQIKHTIADFSGKAEMIEAMHSNIFQFLFKIDYDMDKNNVAKPNRFLPKRRYWIYNGNHSIKLSQNYISENWYKGGLRYLNLLNIHDISFNYSKNKFQSNNKVEWRLNLYTNQNDTFRIYRIGEDLIRTNTTFGIQAINNWYYSSSIELKTQIFKNFKENSEQTLSSALSPLYINISLVGMRYQVEKLYPNVKGKKLNFDTDISPLSIEYITVLNKDIDPKRFGIKEGDSHLTNYGSSVKANLKFFINKNVNFTSRFYYFTNYEKVTAELENKLDMPINRYFSTSLYLFFRYDDNPKLAKDKTLGYYQLNELLSFGFNYNW